jgi:hypothetical protein
MYGSLNCAPTATSSELEIVVAGQGDDPARRIGDAHAERGWNRPPDDRLPAVDPVPRLVDAGPAPPRSARPIVVT